jgi:hypothetical protein
VLAARTLHQRKQPFDKGFLHHRAFVGDVGYPLVEEGFVAGALGEHHVGQLWVGLRLARHGHVNCIGLSRPNGTTAHGPF